jgi:hypothetical protein
VFYRSRIALSLARALLGADRQREAIDAANIALRLVEPRGDIASTRKVRSFLAASS